MPTAYYSHADCRRHEMGEGHPECPQRLDAIADHLLATGLRIPWQVAGASYAIFFPALLLHFSAVQGRWPAALRSPIATPSISIAMAPQASTSSGSSGINS